MYCAINVIQFTSSVSPLKWVDAASLLSEPCTLHFHCYWQQPSSCIHSMRLADTFPRHMSCTQKETQLTYKHLSMPTGMSQKQTGGCSSVRLLHSTKCMTHNMKTTAAENYTWNPLLPSTLFPTEQQTLLRPISCIPNLPVTCLCCCWSMCVYVTYTELCTLQQKCTCCTLSLFTWSLALTSTGLPSHSPTTQSHLN